MKKLFIVGIALLSLASCKKDHNAEPSSNGGNNGNNNGNNGTNQGNVPAEAAGKWLHGTFAMANYWAYDGSYQGNPFSQAVAFDFKSNGNYEMYYAGETNNWGCLSDAFSYFKGYVVFSDSSFIVHPQQGRFRGYYTCSPNYNFDRAATAGELKVDTFYYNYETDINNKKWMVVKFNPTDTFPSYFAATTW